MQNIFTLQKDYTLFRGCRQLVLPLDVEYLIPSDDQVRLLSQFVDSMWLGGLYWTYHRMEKENTATPRQMLKILIYAYMNNIYSTRRIEEACKRDINFTSCGFWRGKKYLTTRPSPVSGAFILPHAQTRSWAK